MRPAALIITPGPGGGGGIAFDDENGRCKKWASIKWILSQLQRSSRDGREEERDISKPMRTIVGLLHGPQCYEGGNRLTI